MQIKTILNHVQKFKPFVYGHARFSGDADQPALEVETHECLDRVRAEEARQMDEENGEDTAQSSTATDELLQG